MKKDNLKRIEAKAKMNMPLTNEEKAYYMLFSKSYDMEVLRCR